MRINILSQLKQGKNFLSFIGFKTIAEGMSFLLPLIIAKFLSPELFGSFSLFKMILFFGTAVFIGPLLAPLNIESNKEFAISGRSNKTFTSSLIYLLFSVSIFLLIYAFFGKELITFTGLNYNEYKFIFLFAFFGLTVKSFLSTFFMSQDNKKTHVLIELFYNILSILFITILFIFDLLILENILLIYFASGLAIFFLSLFFIDYKRIFPLEYSSKNIKIITNFSLWVILGYASSYLINWGDNFVLRYFVSLEKIGIYNFAYQIFKGFIMISLMINTYFTPFIAKNVKNKDIISNYLNVKRKKAMYVVIPSIILISLFIGLPIKLLFTSSYYDAITIFRILSPSIIIAFYVSFYFPIFNSTKNYKINQIFILIQVIINLLFNIILVPLFGIYGAAISTTFAYIIYAILTKIYFNKIMKKYYS